MKIIKVSAILLSAITLLSASAFSQAGNKEDQETHAAIKARLLKIGLEANKIEPSPVKGLFQVITNRGLFYTSEDGQYFVAGRIFDMKAGMTNLTEAALADVRINGINEFKDSMIVFPAKDEKYRVTVFTDTTCTYCKKMHAQMAEYNDLGITVQYLAFPRSGVNSRGFQEIKAVWCSDDQQTAMTKAKGGQGVDLKSCDAPILEHYTLGQSAGVTGTPAIIFEDGSMIPGYKPPKALLQDLSR